ncbi:tetraacyldisaccharide 4'-kinase [Phreatobacter stygius]|uniref:Tetraacyldisaccharide 4'-kinase n=1 Tax=Phreatobacter stygius TaxID=1940610 RepID=A0A4D7B0P9_9HYPH|nr:tetraacyldisaccharide 4'-kinase [Phreatobacter stygius]QCI65065.1 tetraacyldisaccharide 4'-kinase [Phreatobacter stygius]
MKAPGFWSDPASLAGHLLSPLGAIVGMVTLRRMARPGARAALPVICIGNPTVGGSGKSPATLMVAARLAAMGHRPAILTRGYGGALAGPLAVDPAHQDASEVGDEALVHARSFPTIVARDRVAGAAFAARHGATIVVMDDGFQNPSLIKDLTLLTVDAAAGLGNGRVMPAGPLRAPFAPQIARAGALLVVGSGAAGDRLAAEVAGRGSVVVRARLVPEPGIAAWLDGRDVLAFCGIGRPAKFVETLGEAGARNAVLRPFPDHHLYGDADARRLLDEASRTGLPLVTTEKDAVKLRGSAALEALGSAATVIPVRLTPDDPAGLDRLLQPFSPSEP